MMRRGWLLLWVVQCLSILAQPAWARSKTKIYTPIPVLGFDADLLRFRVSQNTLIQGSGTSFSGNLNWYPSLYLNDRLSLRINTGTGPRSFQGISFWEYDFGLALAYEVAQPLVVEFGAGIQAWTEASNAPLPIGYLTVSYLLAPPSEHAVFNSLFLTYSPLYYDLGDKLIHEVRLGVELAF